MLNVRFYLADQNPHRDRSRGISVYSERLMEALREMPELSLSAVTSRSSMRPQPGQPAIAVHELPFRTDDACRRLLADHLHLAMQGVLSATNSSGQGPDLWHFPKGFLPALQRPKVPVVCTIHDTILEHYATHHPKHRSATANSYWLGLLARSVARTDLVLTDSEFSRASIEAFCDKRRIQRPPIAVSYLAPRWESDDKPIEVDDRVMHLMSSLPHKRTQTALDFWKQMQTEGLDLPLLDLVGKASADQRKRLATLSRTRICGELSDEDLKQRIASARALLVPSEIEGFGLPAIEAYCLGTPVVYVKGTAVEEVLGTGTPGGFELESADSFREALDEVLALDADWIAEKSRSLRQRYTWRACAERTLRAYQEIA